MPNNIPSVEIGAMLCRLPNGALTRGAIGVGNATSVQFPDVCPAGSTVIGPWHTHPEEGGGSILPSAQDIREAKRLSAPAQCITNNVKTACYLTRGVQAQQTGSLARLAHLLCK